MGTNNNHFANFLHLVAACAHDLAGNDDTADGHAEAYEAGITPPPVCEHCGAIATYTVKSERFDHLSPVHACDEHARFADGWLRDYEHECHCESMAARAQSEYELDYYSGNE